MAAVASKKETKEKNITTILNNGSKYHLFGDVGIVDTLPNKVLEVQNSMMGLYLEESQPIQLPKKIYSNDKVFISHVLKSYAAATGSLGILLSGEKGLGKSFTANVICDTLELPVIKINAKLPQGAELFPFLNRIKQEHIIFIDEFEKIFAMSSMAKHGDSDYMQQEDFLSFLDSGSIGTKKLFIITSNERVSDYLMNRPTRIRYHRQYKKMAIEVIKEIVEDLLDYQEFKQDLIENIPQKNVNIDVLIKIIQEINLHKVAYSKFKDFFNFQTGDTEIVEVQNENGVSIREASIVVPIKVGDTLFYDPKTSDDVDIKEILSETAMQFVVNTQKPNNKWISDTETPEEDEWIEEVFVLKRKYNVLY
jgi:SpoVK/Ycf46/Vps4 family AAA+-type ATPase